MAFQKAVRTAKRAKIALDGPSGSGKTATALRLARGLAGPDGKVAVIDTERGSASLYAGRFGGEWDKDDELPDFSPKTLMDRLREAERLGYAAVVVDSLSHFWMGTGGELEMVDAAKKRSRSGDGFGAWKEVTPVHNELIQCILTLKTHIVCTMRTKTEWVVEQVQRGDKMVNTPRKIGLAPVQRDGMEYEFDLSMNMDNATGVVSKTRLEVTPLGAVFKEPGEALGEKIAAWLSGAPPPAAPPASVPTPAATPKKPALVVEVREGETEETARERTIYETAVELIGKANSLAQVDKVVASAKGKIGEREAALDTIGWDRKKYLQAPAWLDGPAEPGAAG